MQFDDGRELMAYILLIAHLCGFLSSLNALMTARTSQGAVAWIVALNSFPLAAVPVLRTAAELGRVLSECC